MKRELVWKHLEKHHPTARVAQKLYGKSPWRYETIQTMQKLSDGTKNLEHNHRDVLPEEIVIDLDAEDLQENKVAATEIILSLSQHKLNHSLWHTGGKGYHIHVCFSEIAKVKDPRLMKEIIVEEIMPRKDIRWDKQILGRHLVRMEHGLYDKKFPCHHYKTVVVDNGHFEDNKIWKSCWDEYQKKILRFALNRFRRSKKIPKKGNTPATIKVITSPEFKNYKDGGKRALFVLASYYRKLPVQEFYELLSEFNRYNLRVPLNDWQVQATIKSVLQHQGRHVGERYRRELLADIGALAEVEKYE